MRNRIPKTTKSLKSSPCSHCEVFHEKTKLYNCHIYVEGLNQTYLCFLVIGSVSVSPYELRLVDFTGFLVMSMTPLVPTILPPSLQQHSPSSSNIWLWVCASVSVSCWVNPLWWLLHWSLNYDYSRISIEILSLTFFSSHVWFYPISLGDATCGSWCSSHCQGWDPSPGMGFRLHLLLVG